MPEQITKYPEVTIKVLTGAGARCGEGQTRNYLLCMAERRDSNPRWVAPLRFSSAQPHNYFLFYVKHLRA